MGILKLGLGILSRSKTSEWAYIATRVKVMKRKLIPKEDFNKLINMSVDEIAKYLEETEYKEEIDKLAYKYTGIELIDYALSYNLSKTFRKLIDISTGLPNKLITLYLRKWDIWNLKNIIRGKMFRFSNEEIEATLIPAGEFDEEFLKMLIAKDSVGDVIETFKDKPFYPILEKLTHGAKLSEVEDELDKYCYSCLVKLTAENVDMKYFIDFIKMEVDLANIKTILRLKKEGATVEEIMSRIIPHGYQLKEEECRKLAAMELEEIYKAIESYWFAEEITEEIAKEPLSRIENALTRAWVKKVISIAHSHPLSILPVLAFIVLKKVEVDNIRLIIRGKAQGMDVEEIKKQLVIV